MEELVVRASLVLVRVASFVAILPPMAGRYLPRPVKIGLAIALSAFFTLHGEAVTTDLGGRAAVSGLAFGVLAVRETVLGLGLAMCLGLFLVPAQIAGAYIGEEMGLSMARITGPAEVHQTSVLGTLLESLAGLMFFALNLHLGVLCFLAASFRSHPVGTDTVLPPAGWLVHRFAESIDAGLLIAAPVAVVMMLSLLAILVLMRNAQQFNLFSFGIPVRLAAGLVSLVVFGPELMAAIHRSLLHVGQVFNLLH